jgi:hypothetical protein
MEAKLWLIEGWSESLTGIVKYKVWKLSNTGNGQQEGGGGKQEEGR